MLKSEPKNKQILILYNDEKIRTKSVASFKDLVKFMFGVVNFEYKDSVPLGVDPKYGCNSWFDFTFTDAE